MIFHNDLDNDGVPQVVGNDPTLSSSSHRDSPEGDPEFEVTPEMLVHSGDQENTLEEEEAFNDIDHAAEIEELQKEGELPIEELFAMYYGGDVDHAAETTTPSADTKQNTKTHTNTGGGEGDTKKRKRSVEEEEPHKRMWGDTTANEDNNELKQSRERSELIQQLDLNPAGDDDFGGDGERNEDEFDPFFNQRITRGLAALNSQFFDEEYSTDGDEEYQPSIDNWRKEVQMGEEYQAVVEEGTSEYKPGERENDGDKLLWKPDVVSASELETFLGIAYKLDDMNSQTTERDDEQVLFTLLQSKDMDVALKRRQEQVRKGPSVSLWSEEECQNFEQGLRVFGKDFRLIQRNKVKTRTVGEIVQFYYLWKKTERHDAFVTQTKFGRKKFTLPGISDVMGRFMEENESLFANRSLSPNFEAVRHASENQGQNAPNGAPYLKGANPTHQDSSTKCDTNTDQGQQQVQQNRERTNPAHSSFPIYDSSTSNYNNQEGVVDNTGWSRTSLVPLV